jgi:hypothetical protein
VALLNDGGRLATMLMSLRASGPTGTGLRLRETVYDG